MNLTVREVEPTPLWALPYLDAGRRGTVEHRTLPLHRAWVDRLPSGLDAILCAADLQGREDADGVPGRLLGEVLAAEVAGLGAAGLLPPPERTGVLLAGDLYTVPACDARGGSGDVRPVWEAFASRFRWVAGVAGNHDTFGGDDPNGRRFARRGRGHLLDGATVSVDGLRVGGVGGIVGNPRRLQRRLLPEFLDGVTDVLLREVDVLVLHEGPDAPAGGGRRRGRPEVRELLAEAPARVLVVCGHSHWSDPYAVVAPGVEVLNVDARVVVLLAGEARRGQRS